MTNEEASFILANIDRRVCDDELSNALDMAIKALEQQSCEDCISREQAIKQCGFGMTSLLIADCLRRLPSTTPTRPTGKWLIAPDEEPGYDIEGIKTWYKIATCSKCGFIKPMIEYHIEQYKFCPNCGARMEESEGEE